jgi:hypothetical protein
MTKKLDWGFTIILKLPCGADISDYMAIYRVFIPKPGGTLGYNTIMVPQLH